MSESESVTLNVDAGLGLIVVSFDVRRPRVSSAPRSRLELTPAEQSVARLVVQGYSNAEVARELGVAVRTVANQMAAVLRKQGCRSRFELARLFRE